MKNFNVKNRSKLFAILAIFVAALVLGIISTAPGIVTAMQNYFNDANQETSSNLQLSSEEAENHDFDTVVAQNGTSYSGRYESQAEKAQEEQGLREDAILKDSQAQDEGAYLEALNSELAENPTPNGVVTICIDPGHGGSDPGAGGYGLQEKWVNLSIAQHLRDYLSNYSNCRVVMTRDGDWDVGLQERCDIAKNNGANFFISIHNNASGVGARGVEGIYANNSSYNWSCRTTGYAVVSRAVSYISEFGIPYRSVYQRDRDDMTYNDGHYADYYAVIRGCRYYNIASVIMEHAYIDNAADAAYLADDYWRSRLAQADERALVEVFGLTRGKYAISASVDDNGILNAKATPTGGIAAASNVSFEVTNSAYGFSTWVQAYKNADESWSATYDLDALKKYGYFTVNAWAEVNGYTSKHDTCQVYIAPPQSKYLNVVKEDQTKNTLTLETELSDAAPTDNVSFLIRCSTTGQETWVQASLKNDSNGQVWTAEADMSSFHCIPGSYLISAFENFGTSGLAVGSINYEVNMYKVDFNNSVSTDLTNLHLVCSYAQNANNAAFCVKSPSGKVEWVQAYYDSSNKNWFGNLNLLKFQEYGDYTIQFHVTIGGNTYCIANCSSAVNPPTLASFSKVRENPSSLSFDLSATIADYTPSNLSFCVSDSATKTTFWYQGKPVPSNPSKTWEGNVCIINHNMSSGTYSASVYATFGNGATIMMGKISFDVSISGQIEIHSSVSSDLSTVTLYTDGKLSTDNLSYEICPPDSGSSWYPASYDATSDKWILTLPLNKFQKFGTYKANLYGTFSSGNKYLNSTYFNVNQPTLESFSKVRENPSSLSFDLSATIAESAPTNLSFCVTDSASKTTYWHQGQPVPNNLSKTWEGNVCIINHNMSSGTYNATVYATFGNGVTLALGSITCDVNISGQITINSSVAADSSTVTLSTDGKLGTDNLSYEIIAPNGSSKWYPATYVQAQDKWTLTFFTRDFGYSGTYTARLWGDYPGGCKYMTSTTVGVPTVSLSSDLSLVSKDYANKYFTVSTKVNPDVTNNVAFRVRSSNGVEHWQQASYNSSTKEWTAKISASDHALSSGNYNVVVFANYNGNSYALSSLDVDFVIGSDYIMGPALNTVSQMVNLFNSKGHAYPSSVYTKYGAPDITTWCTIAYNEAVYEGVRPEVLFAQAMLETGWLQFGGDVNPEQCNFGGIGATGGGVGGAWFNDWGANSVAKGLRAQVQHLKAYASTDALRNPCVDPRFNLVTRGCAPRVVDLNGRWAVPGTNYGQTILGIIAQM